MSESSYTKLRDLQYRGPTSSDDYNARIEENYKDLTVLYNRSRVLEEDLRDHYRRILREYIFMFRVVDSLEQRIHALETAANTLSFYDTSQVDNDRFNATPFEINPTSRCTVDDKYGVLTLPVIEGSSFSKLSFLNSEGEVILPSSLATRVLQVESSVDNSGATIETTLPEYSMIINPNRRIWERTIITDTPEFAAECYLYVKLPLDLFTTDKSNVIYINPHPIMGVDLTEIYYSTAGNAVLNDNDGYLPLNVSSLYESVQEAVGWVPPGAWDGDEIINSGPKAFYFDPEGITALRFKLRQPNYFKENNNYIYSYGMSLLDIMYKKFLDSGKIILRFTPATGTISSVDDVQPAIYNLAQSAYPDVFSYRTIWETSYNSGVYTTTEVPFSTRVWIEITLNKSEDGGTPALSGLSISYS